MRFYDWLMKFDGVDHALGDFVSDVKHDKQFPEGVSSLSEMLLYLSRKGASDACLECACMAWETFRIWDTRHEYGSGKKFRAAMENAYALEDLLEGVG